MQLKINNKDDTIFEWIPYNQFIHIKETNSYSSVYLAEWKNSPLHWNKNKYERDADIKSRMVKLKYLCNFQNITNEFLNNEVQNFFKFDL
jgi:hypothetical protein